MAKNDWFSWTVNGKVVGIIWAADIHGMKWDGQYLRIAVRGKAEEYLLDVTADEASTIMQHAVK